MANTWYDSDSDVVRRLRENLRRARRAIITLLPDNIQELAETYRMISTRLEAQTWEDALVDAVIGIAWPIGAETQYAGPRAYCPLCRRGSSGPYAEGFALPGGLRKHLLGEGNAYPCEVLSQVIGLAEDHWRPQVAEAESRERASLEVEKERRREIEDLYLTGPGAEPKLRDEFLFGDRSRDDESLGWAKDRLRQLGFTESRVGRVRQFTKEFGELVVFADPREVGKLNFSVYRKEQVERPKKRRHWTPDHASFHVLDSWRNRLDEKIAQGVEEAERTLVQRRRR